MNYTNIFVINVKKIEYKNKEEFLSYISDKECWFFSSHAEMRYTDISFPIDKDVYLIFGKESVGLGEDHRERRPQS